jgi:Spy/CpxP family protein refolding chaperone
MTMRQFTHRLALIAMMFVVAAVAVMAQPGGDGRGVGRDPHVGNKGGLDPKLVRCLETLELTPEVKREIAGLQERYANFVRETHQQLERLHNALREAKSEGNRERVAEIMRMIEEKNAALRSASEGLTTAVLALLSERQIAALRECMEKKPGGGDDRGKGRKGDGRKDCWEQLELSREQLARIAELRNEYHADNAALMQEIRELHTDMREARRNRDREAAEAIREEIRAKMAELKAAQEQLKSDIHNVLTEEQRQALEDCLEGERGDGGRGGRGPGRALPERVVPELK